jgi:diguanylate cyclase (GGDEF)-like protein/PAS domain S-box-containing protein
VAKVALGRIDDRRKSRPVSRREHRLEAAEARWRAVFENAPVAMMELSFDGTVLVGNPALAELTGHTLHELVGSSWLFLVHPDDRPALKARLSAREAGEAGPGKGLDLRILRADGAQRWVSARGSLLSTEDADDAHVLLHLADVTAERARREALEEARARFSALVEHGSDLIAIVDSGLVLRYASPVYGRIFGTDPQKDLGRPVCERVHPGDREQFADVFVRLGQKPRGVETFLIRVSPGEAGWRTLEVTASNHVADPVIAGFVCNARDVTERVQVTERLAHQAMHDTLTGLANRVLLLDRMEHALAAEGQGDRSAVLFVDLDRFKAVNDRQGHAAGDHLLVAVAERLQRVVRPGDTVARLGGDEFVVLAEHVTKPEAATQIAERVRLALAKPVDLKGRQLTISCSIGIAFSGHDLPEAMLNKADVALYQAKQRGRDRWEIFDEDMVENPDAAHCDAAYPAAP